MGILGMSVVLATGFVLAFQGMRHTVLALCIEHEWGEILDERVLAERLRDGGHKFDPFERILLRLPAPYVWWAIILALFFVADLFVLLEAG